MPTAKVHTPPPAGTVFRRKYKGREYSLTVVVSKDGGVGYKVRGELFTSPSSAAKSVTGSDSNGWVWWGIEKPGDRP